MEKQQEEQQRRIAILTKQLITPSETASVTKKKEAVNSVSQQVRSVITDINNINRKHWAGVDPTKVDVNQLNVPMPPIVRGNILAFFDQIENQLVSEDGYNLSEHLPGPMNDIGMGKKYADVKAILAQIMRHTNAGTNHMLWMDFQNNYLY